MTDSAVATSSSVSHNGNGSRSGKRKKRIRTPCPPLPQPELQVGAGGTAEEDRGENSKRQRPSPPDTSWKNLDLVLSLQNKQLPFSSKIELASDFVNRESANESESCAEPLHTLRTASFVGDWIQHRMISLEHGKRNNARKNNTTINNNKPEEQEQQQELISPSLDARSWSVLKFCLVRSHFRVSPNILRPITSVLCSGVAFLEENSGRSTDQTSESLQECRLYKSLFDCLDVLFPVHGKIINNAGVDLWITCALAAVSLIKKILSRGDATSIQLPTTKELLSCLCCLVLEQLSGFLRFHPSPKNVFRPFVDKLFEPLLELLATVRSQTSKGESETAKKLLAIVHDILSNGLFHPSHMMGFLSIKGTDFMQDEGDTKAFNESYHRHLFFKINKIISGKQVLAITSLGELLHLLAARAKRSKVDALISRELDAGVPEQVQESSPQLFEVFAHFTRPFLLECNNFIDMDLKDIKKDLDSTLSEADLVIQSLNVILYHLMHEKIYTPLKDIAEGTHYTFLKEIYVTIIAFARKVIRLWSKLKNHDPSAKLLSTVAAEVVTSLGHFIEIEYQIIGEDLVSVWLLVLSSLGVYIYYVEPQDHDLTISKILETGSRLINLYSELRQVERPIFALFKAVRFLSNRDYREADSPLFLSDKPFSLMNCSKAVASLLLSQGLNLAISTSMRLIPEGQAGSFLENIKLDILKSLEWVRACSSKAEGNLLNRKNSTSSHAVDIGLTVELLGLLSEPYTMMLSSLSVTSSNSNLVANSLVSLLTAVQPTLTNLPNGQTNSRDFLSHVLFTKREKVEFQDSIAEHMDPSWIFVFLLRLYVSCRSLCQQVLSFIPHNSKKAAALISVLAVSHGTNAANEPDWRSQSYFSLVGTPSHYLPVIIKSILEHCSSCSSAPHGPLLYVLHSMTLQRLNDLNRQIKTFKFLQKKESFYAQTQIDSADSAAASSDNEIMWKSHIRASKEEAASLSNYLTEYMTSIASRVNSVTECAEMPLNISSWGFSVCTLDENSLPTAIWWLLCKNIDVWCTHSSSKMLKIFLDLVISFALPTMENKYLRNEVPKMHFQKKVTVHQISSELLMDTFFYEQKVVSKYVFPRFLRILKKSSAPLFAHAVILDANSSLLPDWTKTLSMLDKSRSFDSTSGHTPTTESEIVMSDGRLVNLGLKTCQNLLDLLCRVVKVHVNISSIKSLMIYILDIERLTVISLLRRIGDPYFFTNIELLQLFVSCRRTFRYLAASSSERALTNEQSPLVQFLSENPLSIAWFLKSVCEVAAMPYSLFLQEDYHDIKEHFAILMDHSSYIFMVSSKGCILELDNIEMVADILKDQTERFLKMYKWEALSLDSKGDSLQYVNILSHLVSCIQGFLSGALSVLSSQDKKTFKKNAQKCTFSCYSNLYSYTKVFEALINLWLTRLFEDVQSSKSLHPKKCLAELKHGMTSADQYPFLDAVDKTHVECFDIAPNEEFDCSLCGLKKGDKGSLLPQCTQNPSIQQSASINHENGQSILQGVYSVDLLRHLNDREDLLERLLNNELPEVAFLVRQLYMSSATILNLQFLLSPTNSQSEVKCIHQASYVLGILLGTAFQALQKLVDMKTMPHSCTYIWVEGIFKYLEVIGRYISLTDPVLSRNVYTSLIDVHLSVLGKCILLQGKSAALASHEMGSSTKNFQPDIKSHDNDTVCNNHTENLNELKASLRASLTAFIKTPLELHLLSAVQAIERSLVGIGVQENIHAIYGICTGDFDGGRVSPSVAAGIDCLDLFLESVSGKRSLGIARRHIQSLLSALFNIIAHLQSPIVFYHRKALGNWNIDPDPGSVILMCVEVLAKIAGKNSISQMDSWVVSQYLELPMALFNDFLMHPASKIVNHVKTKHPININRQFCVDIYAACCKLLCTTLRHRMSAMGRCIPLLQNSVNVLLTCLETVDADFGSQKDYFAWETREAKMCASFLRRVYEEIRQQKGLVARYASHFLSSYISIYSGFGLLRSGIKREIDEVLRPGIYALLDICTPDDLQQLHTVLADGTCRRTLSTLQHDYRLNFQFEGKI